MTSTWPEKRAFTVSVVGLVFQVALAAFLILVALWNHSQATRAAGILAACGTPIWLFLILVYKQREAVRLEQLEVEELRRERAAGGTESIFAGDEERLLLARRRLAWLYRWILPAFTILILVLLVVFSLRYWAWPLSGGLYSNAWTRPVNEDLSVAFIAGASFLAFLLSRYTTGMGRQPEWRLLRAGAAWLMGCTLAGTAVAAMLVLASFDMVMPERTLAYVLRIVMLVLAGEILLNFILDFYRPRQRGEEPRPAFESRLFGLFCEPGGIARSIADALNYQFGFEVSSTWFYKLMQRATTPVIFFGVVTMFAVSCLVVVDPGEAVIIERFGVPRQTGATLRRENGLPVERDALGPGLHWKAPWPIDVAYRYPVDQVQEVTIGIVEEGAKPEDLTKPLVWSEKHPYVSEVTVIVAKESETAGPAASPQELPPGGPATQPATDRSVPVSLLRISMPIHFRIDDLKDWRETFADPRKVFEDMAFRELVKYSAGLDVDQVMGADRQRMAKDLRELIQAEADRLRLGVRIVMLGLQGVHPPSEVAKEFEAVIGAESKRLAAIRSAEAVRNKLLAEVVGDVERAERLAIAISKLDAPGVSDEEARQARRLVDLYFDGDPERGISPVVTGRAAQIVAEARARMWERINEARSDAEAFRLELPVYRAAPRIYRLRRYMETLAEGLVGIRKYLLATDVNPVYQLQLMDPVFSGLAESLEAKPRP